MKLTAPSVRLTWLPGFASSIVALFKQKMDRPFWLWSATTANLPTATDMGANEGALAYDETLNRPSWHDGSAWQPVAGLNTANTWPETQSFTKPPVLPSFTVATLPAAGTAGAGAVAFVTNANATTFASIVAGGGANKVPVFSDGTNWRIG